eukprot:2480681-Prymnesium_polylepis.2
MISITRASQFARLHYHIRHHTQHMSVRLTDTQHAQRWGHHRICGPPKPTAYEDEHPLTVAHAGCFCVSEACQAMLEDLHAPARRLPHRTRGLL